MATEVNEREVNVGSMPIEQLNQLKTQHENEIRELQGQVRAICTPLASDAKAGICIYPYAHILAIAALTHSSLSLPSLCPAQLETLHGAKNRFIGARMTIDEMKKMPEGTPILVPLNGSLYAPGTIATPDKVIVELGTGYFCEKVSPHGHCGVLSIQDAGCPTCIRPGYRTW